MTTVNRSVLKNAFKASSTRSVSMEFQKWEHGKYFLINFGVSLLTSPMHSLCLIADSRYYLFLSNNVQSPNIPVCVLNSYQQGIWPLLRKFQDKNWTSRSRKKRSVCFQRMYSNSVLLLVDTITSVSYQVFKLSQNNFSVYYTYGKRRKTLTQAINSGWSIHDDTSISELICR